MNTKITDAVALGFAGIGITTVIGVCAYDVFRQKNNTPAPAEDNTEQIQNNIRNSMNVTPKLGQKTPPREPHWSDYLSIPNLREDSALYNSVDALSVFWYCDTNAFLNIVRTIEEYYAMYNAISGGMKLEGAIGVGSQYLLNILNLVGRFEESVRAKYRNDPKIMKQFEIRSQTVLQICDSYNVNIIRDSKM